MLRTLALFALAVPALLGAQAPKIIRSSNPSVPLTRITKVQNLVERDGLTISLTVQDLGGTTDVSPTKQLFLGMYLKGEMFNVDAAFDLGAYFDLVSVTRTAAGLYEVRATDMNADAGGMVTAVLKIDARQATVDIRAVRCEDFDCPGAEKFKTAITMTRSVAPASPPRRE